MKKTAFVLLIILMGLLCVIGAGQAEDDVEYKIIEYDITISVGDTITLYDMPFRAYGTGDHYSEEMGPPGMSVYATGEEGAVGYNAFQISYETEFVEAGGSFGSTLNRYLCTVNATLTGTAAGSGIVDFQYSTFHVPTGSNCNFVIPRLRVHVC